MSSKRKSASVMEKASTSGSKRKATTHHAGGSKSKKTKSGKATRIDLSAAAVKSKFHQASVKPPSKVLWPQVIQISGKFSCSQKEMQDLVTTHGGKIGSKASFNLLIATDIELWAVTNKVHRANLNNIPIVHELFLFDTIIKGKQPDMEPYLLRNCVMAEGQDDDSEEETEEVVKVSTAATDLRNIAPSTLGIKYRLASEKPTSNAMRSYTVQFTGKFCGTQKDMHNLVLSHGGSIGTKSVFTLLIASSDEYRCKSWKVLTAEMKEVPIVHETFLYDTIIKGKTPKIAKYDWSKN